MQKIVHHFIKKLQAKAACCHDDKKETERALSHSGRCPEDYAPVPVGDLQFSSCEECLKKRNKNMGEIGSRGQNSHSLANLRKGETGRVAFIRGGHKMLRRLLDMGITPNATIKIIKVAPLRGPVEISVRGSNLALGRSIAANVFIEPIHNESEAEHG